MSSDTDDLDSSVLTTAPSRADVRRLKWFIAACVVLVVAWLSISTVTTAAQPVPPAEAKATPDSPGLIIELI